ncbi:MAG: DotG/IcmE/VirB10 family protein [Alphaproteobacteria bacterium]
MNDDLDEEIIGTDEGFDEFAQKSSLGDAVRTNPLVKVGMVVVALAVVAGVFVMFSGDPIEEQASVISGGSTVTAAPGSEEEIAPAYVDAIEQQNEEDLERAIRDGSSAIPVPIETRDTRLEIPEVQEQTEDPLHRWRALQEERIQREMKSKQIEEEPVTVLDAEQQNEAIQKLSDSMAEQMQAVLANTSALATITTRTLISYDNENGVNAGAGSGSAGGGPDAGGGSFEEDTMDTIVVPAGKIFYGQLLLEANSDVPSTVLAQVLSGPLKGWKLLGEFSVLDNIEMLAIEFNLAVNDEGKQLTVSAVMLNPETTLPALRTDVDHRYFRRIVLPAAAAFIEGFSEAIAETGRTSVTVEGDTVVEEEEEASNDQEVASGVTEAATEVSEILDDLSDVPVRIIIEAGTPMGIFFTENVIDQDGEDDI